MSWTNGTPYQQLLMDILAGSYANLPWRYDGEDIQADIALDLSGALPVWWNQVEKTSALLGIASDRLPAMIVDDHDAMTGKKLVWKDAEDVSYDEQYLLRGLLPEIAMDAIHILHQQENILADQHHLEMFADENSITKNLIEGLSVAMLLNECKDNAPIDIQRVEHVLPNEESTRQVASEQAGENQTYIH
jgi:hypothetical protein